jgi:hypothetical protein
LYGWCDPKLHKNWHGWYNISHIATGMTGTTKAVPINSNWIKSHNNHFHENYRYLKRLIKMNVGTQNGPDNLNIKIYN